VEQVVRDADHLAVQSGGDPAYPLVIEQASPGPFVVVVAAFDLEVCVFTTGQPFPAGAVGFGQEADLHHGAHPARRSGQRWTRIRKPVSAASNVAAGPIRENRRQQARAATSTVGGSPGGRALLIQHVAELPALLEAM